MVSAITVVRLKWVRMFVTLFPNTGNRLFKDYCDNVETLFSQRRTNTIVNEAIYFIFCIFSEVQSYSIKRGEERYYKCVLC